MVHLRQKYILNPMRKSLAFLLVVSFTSAVHAQRNQTDGGSLPKEFMTSVTYGVLAGTLVGAATLAFTKSPGENLNKIARGASLGLYLGIGLGFYVVYGVDDGREDDLGGVGQFKLSKKHSLPKLALYPIFTEKGNGLGAAWRF